MRTCCCESWTFFSIVCLGIKVEVSIPSLVLFRVTGGIYVLIRACLFSVTGEKEKKRKEKKEGQNVKLINNNIIILTNVEKKMKVKMMGRLEVWQELSAKLKGNPENDKLIIILCRVDRRGSH